MFEKYTYKQKCIALVLLFAVLCITAYKRSFSTLVSVISEYQELSAKSEEINKKSGNFTRLEAEIAELDKIIGKEGITREMVQQGIIGFVSENYPDTAINDLQPIHSFSDENYTVYTNSLDLTGNINQLLRAGYGFEKEFRSSRLVSMNFYTAKNNNKPDVLHLKMIFQNYENNK